jgi:FtsP/CotA-like multicopper oxidase with cupredoxin domain
MFEQTEPARGGRKTIMKLRMRRSGLLVALVTGAALLPGPAAAIPPNAPAIGMICTPGTVVGSTHTFNLATKKGYVETPDGNSVFIWSYANADPPDNSHFQYPGPVLCVTQGETVVVNLTNNLSPASSIVFPGQDGAVTATGGAPGLLTTEAAGSGGTVSYAFTANNAGTYIYESGSDVSRQIEMGLYGALVVRPALGPNYAYNNATQFNPSREYILLLSELDPDLHKAVETGGTYDITKLHNRYWMVNGRSFPDTIQDNGIPTLPNQPYGALIRAQSYDPVRNPQPALIRMLNVGALNHPFHPHGNHLTQVAQDGRQLLTPSGGSASTERFGETIGSGQTQDYLLTWKDQDLWSPTNPLPVAQPNYRNLFFKDANTWYSGNPYLGYSGTLPTGTLSQNVCGEWYFPWHSHALNEFTNFDEGFGGMATLLRVDPLGGCFGFPTATKVTLGTLSSGTFTNLSADDASYYKLNSTTTGTRTTDWYGQFGAVAPGATNLTVSYKGRNCLTATGCTAIPAPSPTATLSLWNWTTSAWVQLAGPTAMNATDVTLTIPPIASPGSYIGKGSNKGLVRVRVLTTRTGTTNFVTGGNLMKLVYDAP